MYNKYSTQVLEICKNENEPANIRNEPILLKKHKVGHVPLWILKEHALMSIMAFLKADLMFWLCMS